MSQRNSNQDQYCVQLKMAELNKSAFLEKA